MDPTTLDTVLAERTLDGLNMGPLSISRKRPHPLEHPTVLVRAPLLPTILHMLLLLEVPTLRSPVIVGPCKLLLIKSIDPLPRVSVSVTPIVSAAPFLPLVASAIIKAPHPLCRVARLTPASTTPKALTNGKLSCSLETSRGPHLLFPPPPPWPMRAITLTMLMLSPLPILLVAPTALPVTIVRITVNTDTMRFVVKFITAQTPVSVLWLGVSVRSGGLTIAKAASGKVVPTVSLQPPIQVPVTLHEMLVPGAAMARPTTVALLMVLTEIYPPTLEMETLPNLSPLVMSPESLAAAKIHPKSLVSAVDVPRLDRARFEMVSVEDPPPVTNATPDEHDGAQASPVMVKLSIVSIIVETIITP